MSEFKKALLYDAGTDVTDISKWLGQKQIPLLVWEERHLITDETRVLLYLNDEQIKTFLKESMGKNLEIGIMPHPENQYAAHVMGVTDNFEQMLNLYQASEAIDIDVMLCNDDIVLSSVSIGTVYSLKPYDANQTPFNLSSYFYALKHVKDLRLHQYIITTGKESKFSLAALGMVAIEQTQSKQTGRCFLEDLSFNDHRLTLLAFSPRSILAYFWFLLLLILPKKISLQRLPGAIGLIRTQTLLIESPRTFDYLLDGQLKQSQSVSLMIHESSLRILPGPDFQSSEESKSVRERDTIKLNHLPIDETARQLVEKQLPLFNRAREDEYRDLFVSLRENAVISSSFIILMILSVLMALMGLYANSAPVIIGAMILAPLMAPIISLSMGLARTEPGLIRSSMLTLSIGIFIALTCAIVVSLIIPLDILTSEMQSRLSPTLLDLTVAVVSGIAGAYAHAKEEIAKSLAGVAIAVALVPPLGVIGIGIGWQDWSIARGASLLFITNLFGISLAASVTFLVMGFAPFKMARKGLLISLVLLSLVAVPLSIAFTKLVKQGNIIHNIPVGQVKINEQRLNISNIDVKMEKVPLVRAIISSEKRLTEADIEQLKNYISQKIGQEIILEAQTSIRR
jgi:uncharacterized hydrophobic protein (TIGR00271 family)